MKILHTADWHLGKRLDAFSRFDEQRQVLDEICQIAEAEDVDAVLVAGDLFDTLHPTAEATELLYSTLCRLSAGGTRAVVAIAGNHDSPERIDVPDSMARTCGILFVGFPNADIKPYRTPEGLHTLRLDRGFVELKLPRHDAPLRLLLTPYANELRLKTFLGTEAPDAALREVLAAHWHRLADTYCDEAGVNLLMTHLFFVPASGEVPEEPDGERSILHVGGASAVYAADVPPQIRYVALGHLHRFQTIAEQPCPVVYSSSPLAYSFAEAGQTKYVVVVEAEPGQPVSYRPVALTSGKSLKKARFEDVTLAETWLADNADALVQLTVATDTYLEATDKKRLLGTHAGIVALIPEVTQPADTGITARQVADVANESLEDLFVGYFQSSKEGKGQAPSESLLRLFREVLAVELEK
jgi:exonuclease SbcD